MTEIQQSARPIFNHHIENSRVNPYVAVGTTVAGTRDATEALVAGGLDWTVALDPISTTHLGLDGVTTVEIPGKFATNRINRDGSVAPLAVVGSKYSPIQNLATAEALQFVVDTMEADFLAVGHTHNGAKTFVQMLLPQNVSIGGRDPIRWTLLALNSHDGSSQFTIAPTATRIWCENQLPSLRKTEIAVKFRHTSGSTDRVDLEKLRADLGLTVKHVENFTALGNKLVEQPMTLGEFLEFTDQVFPRSLHQDGPNKGKELTQSVNRRLALKKIFTGAENLENVRGTRWAAYNAVTEYTNWVQGATGKVSQAERVVTGVADDKGVKALALLAR